MRTTVCLALFVALAALAQTTVPVQSLTQPAAPRPVSLLSLPPDTLVATIDGQKVLAGEFQVFLRQMQPAQQQATLSNPQAFLQQYALMRRLSSIAEKAGVDKSSPVKEQLAYNRMLALANAELQITSNQFEPSLDDVRKSYDSHQDQYKQALTKLIYIPFSAAPPANPDPGAKKVLSESEAKAKAEKLYADLKAGADCVKLVKENSGDPASAAKEGDFMPIRRSDQVPEEIKAAVFALKPGEVCPPIRQPNGFYVFRLTSLETQPFEGLRQQLADELRGSRMSEWVRSTQESVPVKIELEDAFKPAQPPAAADK